MRFTLQEARDWADLLLKATSVVAIILGGYWAYYQYWITDVAASNIQITVSAESFKYSDDYRLLIVHAKPKNIGKVSVEPGKDGLLLTVRKLQDDLKPGPVDLEKLPEIYKNNMLLKFSDGYELEPGVEYDEIETLVVPRDGMYSLTVVMDLGEKYEVDHTSIVKVE